MMANTTQHFHENLIQKQDRKADSFWSGPTKQCHIRWRRVMEWIIKHFQALFSHSSTLLHRSSPHRPFKPSYLVCPVLTKSKRVYKPILRSHNGCLWRHIQLKCSHSESIKKANELTAGNAAIVPPHCEQVEGPSRPCMLRGQWLKGSALIYTGIPAGLQPKCKTRFTHGGPLAHHNGTVPRALKKETEWKQVREIKESSRSHFGYWLPWVDRLICSQ